MYPILSESVEFLEDVAKTFRFVFTVHMQWKWAFVIQPM